MKPRKHPRAEELEGLAAIVAAVEVQQQDHPGYCQDMLDCILNTELRRLEQETAPAANR
jgi:hypothetical protein